MSLNGAAKRPQRTSWNDLQPLRLSFLYEHPPPERFLFKKKKNPFEISRHHEREKLSLLESVNINPEPVQRHETTRGGKRTYFDDV